MGIRMLRAAVVAALATALAGTAVASRQEIDRADKTRLGRGPTVADQRERGAFQYYQVTELPALQAPVGSIELTVRRSGASSYNYYPMLEFLDAGGDPMLSVMVQWEDVTKPGESSLYVWGEYKRGLPYVWGKRNFLGRRVAPGETVKFTLTWGSGPDQNRIYVDGREVRAYTDGDPWKATARAGKFSDSIAGARWARVPDAAVLAGLPEAARPADQDTEVQSVAFLDSAALVAQPRPADVAGLTAEFVDGTAVLRWNALPVGTVVGYEVYRRDEAAGGRYLKLTPAPVKETTFKDTSAAQGRTYYYSVYGVAADGVESGAGAEVELTLAALSIASVAADRAVYGAGQEVVVTLRGTANKEASFTLDGVASKVAMKEVDDGVYAGRAVVPAGVNVEKVVLTGVLADRAAGKTVSLAGAPVAVDTAAPEGVPRIIASVPWPGEIELSWDRSPSSDADRYLVFRSAGAHAVMPSQPYETVAVLTFSDKGVIPGLEYHYQVAPVDKAGNRGPLSEVVSATALPGEGPRISSVTLEPFGKPARPGETVTVTATGESGGQATVDLGGLALGIPLKEEGRTGRYAATYTVTEKDVGPVKASERVVVHLADAFGSSLLAGPELVVVGRDALADTTPPAIAGASHNGWQVAGLSGKLVAGDVVAVTLQGEPGGYAHFDVLDVANNVPMTESSPGTYAGSFAVKWGATGKDVPVVVRLADEAGNESSVQAERLLTLDTRVRLLVSAQDKLLPADRKSQTRLTARAQDANGKEVSGHELALTLSTTAEYTGVVGGGSLEGREARATDVDNVEVKWGGVTDSFGEVSATYTAGLAAKTALVVAKDLATGDVGAGWLNTYVASTVALELLPRTAKGAADRAILRMEGDPAKLTADGRSTSRIRVWMTDLSGTPLSGARVDFALANGNGRVRIIRGRTDGKGTAEAEYRAGTLAGTVTVTAVAADYGVAGTLQIVLLSDAPAKIDLVASASHLPADGSSTAALSVRVTDINANPNPEVPVTFAVLKGSGKVSKPSILTDRNGEGSAAYTAGSQPGLVTIEARHTSRGPTADELRRIYGTVFVPRLFERQERDRLKVAEWLVKAGEKVDKGQTLGVLSTRRGEWAVTSPAKGVFVRQVKYEGDAADLGDTLGYVEIDPDVWKTEYAK